MAIFDLAIWDSGMLRYFLLPPRMLDVANVSKWLQGPYKCVYPLFVFRIYNSKNVNISTNEKKDASPKIKQRTDTRTFCLVCSEHVFVVVYLRRRTLGYGEGADYFPPIELKHFWIDMIWIELGWFATKLWQQIFDHDCTAGIQNKVARLYMHIS